MCLPKSPSLQILSSRRRCAINSRRLILRTSRAMRRADCSARHGRHRGMATTVAVRVSHALVGRQGWPIAKECMCVQLIPQQLRMRHTESVHIEAQVTPEANTRHTTAASCQCAFRPKHDATLARWMQEQRDAFVCLTLLLSITNVLQHCAVCK